jgi:predicted nicotinamide N-methyase
MGYRALKPDDLIEEVVALDGRELCLLRPRDAAELIDEERFEQGDEFIPYWADLWPSAILLARTLSGRALRGARVLELGCGLGLPSLAAALAGGRVLATDWAPEALEAVERNAAHNGVALETLVSDWREPEELLSRGPFDLVIAADVAYEQRNVRPLTQLLTALDCEAWIADPGRPPAAELVGNLEITGFSASTLAQTTSPSVTVHRLEPGRMY